MPFDRAKAPAGPAGLAADLIDDVVMRDRNSQPGSKA